MADGYVYRSFADLHALGQRVVDKAAEVVLWQDDSYSQAQQGSINDYTKSQTPGMDTGNPHYAAPSSGRPEDNANVQEYVRQALADVPGYFTAFSVPDPDSINASLTGPLYRTAGTLVPSLKLTRKAGGQLSTDSLAGADAAGETIGQLVGHITTIHMKYWTGDAANAFSGYCAALADAAGLQHQLATSLAEVMDAHLEIRRRQLTDIWTIGETTIKVLDSLDQWCMNRKKSTQTVLTVVGAIAAVVVVAAAPEALPAGSAVAAEAIQSLGAILGTVPDKKDEALSISGATVQAVIQSMTDAIHKLYEYIDRQEQLLAQALGALRNATDMYRQMLLVPSPREFTALAGADIDTVRGVFYDR
ncbi:hypothetical protein Acy02nite_46950 [Actinoplanes cyaneus]|uniref:Uncharacterized protein n=1 Tax=Actinoplanes cyaneus TaxID=52696 RepID=A0A919M8T8_9ACTN|nr:hypothetical protein [Actinoplanes cyaneus]MCW2138849.1 hypothetical protein [Actinoplanes cyaneus]GID66814.1 hypothetical protein Acy02nite_46950 [Actinoplanes cyaneus]